MMVATWEVKIIVGDGEGEKHVREDPLTNSRAGKNDGQGCGQRGCKCRSKEGSNQFIHEMYIMECKWTSR